MNNQTRKLSKISSMQEDINNMEEVNGRDLPRLLIVLLIVRLARVVLWVPLALAKKGLLLSPDVLLWFKDATINMVMLAVKVYYGSRNSL